VRDKIETPVKPVAAAGAAEDAEKPEV